MGLDFDRPPEGGPTPSVNISDGENYRVREDLRKFGLRATPADFRDVDHALTYHFLTSGSVLNWLELRELKEDARLTAGGPFHSIVTVETRRILRPPSGAREGLAATTTLPVELSESRGGLATPPVVFGGFRLRDGDINDALKRWHNDILAALDRALTFRPSIVCFGEFDLPPESGGRTEFESELRRQLIADLDDAITGRLVKHLEKRGVDENFEGSILLVAGSRHSWQHWGCQNLARIYRAFRKNGKVQTAKTRDHAKRVSAKELGECLMPHPEAKIEYYRTDKGNVAVLVCIDALDPGVLGAIVSVSDPTDDFVRPHIILVPSYNPGERLFDACQFMSYASGALVVYVNAFDVEHARSLVFDASRYDHPGCEVFACGVGLSSFADDREHGVANIDDVLQGFGRTVEFVPQCDSRQTRVTHWKVPRMLSRVFEEHFKTTLYRAKHRKKLRDRLNAFRRRQTARRARVPGGSR